MSEVLDQARQQVLVNGEGLRYDQLVSVLNTADEQLDALLALAHEVRAGMGGRRSRGRRHRLDQDRRVP